MNIKQLTLLSILYLAIPLIIFSIGFLRFGVGIPFVVILVFCIYQYIKVQNITDIPITLRYHAVLFVVALLLCFLSGIGGFYTQTGDYLVKNALLRDLCNNPWPLYIDLSAQPKEIQTLIGSDKVAFVYYLFFYLPAALIGRFGGETLARVVFLCWSSCGLYLVFLTTYVFVFQKVTNLKRSICALLILFFCFGGLDIIGYIRRLDNPTIFEILVQYPLTSFCECWCMPYFRLWGAHIHDLSFVFNQCIPAWLITMLILNRCNNKSLIFIYSFSLLYSPWSAIGLFPIVAYLFLFDIRKGEKAKWYSFIDSINIRNVLFPLLLLFIVGSYYTSNSGSTETKGWFVDFMSLSDFVVYYPLFILIEIGLYIYFLRKQILKEKVLTISLIVLLLLPFYHITPGNDLLMRAAIPPLFVIFAYWSKFVVNNFSKNKIVIGTVLFLTSFSSSHTLIESVTPIIKTHSIRIVDPIGSFYGIQTPSCASMCDFQFFAHDYQKSLFFKYLARQ